MPKTVLLPSAHRFDMLETSARGAPAQGGGIRKEEGRSRRSMSNEWMTVMHAEGGECRRHPNIFMLHVRRPPRGRCAHREVL
eukprot:4452477-Pyramimonas_sp.AAC.1